MHTNYAPLVVFLVIAVFILLFLISIFSVVDFSDYGGLVAGFILYFIVFFCLVKYMCERGNMVGAWVLALFLPILVLILSVLGFIQGMSSAASVYNEFSRIMLNGEHDGKKAFKEAFEMVYGTDKTLSGSTVSGCPTECPTYDNHLIDYPDGESISGVEMD